MPEIKTDDLVTGLEQCEDICRSLIAAGKLQELEKPLRIWENLLADAAANRNPSLDYFYFEVVFQQINAGLYQNAGKTQQMKQHFLQGKDAAENLEKLLPLDEAPENVPEREKIMALNCAEFARVASLALETLDTDVSLKLAQQSARLYDWLWSDLAEQSSIIAVEIHLKLASLAILFQNDMAESKRQLAIVKEKYSVLYQRTGNSDYVKKAENVSLGVDGQENISKELLDSNPALALLYRTAHFTDLGTQSMMAQESEQAGFYYDKAAQEAEKMLMTMKQPEACRVAVLAFLGAATFQKEISTEKAKTLALKGLQVCELLKQSGDAEFSPKEIAKMQKEFDTIVQGKKQGFIKRFLGF